jgi:hypothetical protein
VVHMMVIVDALNRELSKFSRPFHKSAKGNYQHKKRQRGVRVNLAVLKELSNDSGNRK